MKSNSILCSWIFIITILAFNRGNLLKAQCVTTSLSFTNCPSSTGQSFTNQGGANNGSAPVATCNFGTGSPSTSTWISFVYDPASMNYLMGDQAAGGAGNDPGMAIYSSNGCTLLGCNDDFNNVNSMPGFGNSTAGIDLTTLGLVSGNTYLIRMYNEGNTVNTKNPKITCVPPSPCGDCFSNPCNVGLNVTVSSSTNGSKPDDCCKWTEDQFGAVPALNCSGPGFISSDGNMYYAFTICGAGTVTATIHMLNCNNSAGSQIWFVSGCNGSVMGNQCSNTGTMADATLTYGSFAVGPTYYVMVDSYGGNICDFTLTMTGPVCTLPCTPPTLSSSNVNPTCGSSNGSIDLIAASGTSPYTYLWSNTATTEDLSSLSGGTYTVTVTASGGCTSTFSTTLTSTGAPTISLVTQINVLCNGASTGSLDINVTGGTAPYTYIWSSGATTQDISTLAVGTYTVTVTTASSCTNTASYIISSPTVVTVTLASSTNVICPCDATGSINITTSGGTPGYTYIWSTGATLEDISSLVDGTYTVTVTDANSCTKTLSVVITEPAQITIALNSQTNINCFGQCSGSVTIQASGGTSPYDYSNNGGVAWQFSNTAVPVTYSALCAGSYTYTVRDNNGCLTH